MRETPNAYTASTKIGVVTVTYNSAGVLDDFMESLARQSNKDWRLFVIDNASSDDTLARLDVWRQQSSVFRHTLDVIANRENLGVAEGNNQGIAAALADGCTHVLLLNNDTVFDETLLDGLLQGQTRLDADMVIPKMVYHDQPDTIWCAGGYYIWHMPGWVQHFGLNKRDSAAYDAHRYVVYAPTTCMLIDRTVFDRVGLMDRSYFVYYDDVDFCFRSQKAGIRLVYVPWTLLRHKVSALTGGETSPFYLRFITRNRALFVLKNYPVAVREFALAYQFLWIFGSWLRHRNGNFLKIRLRAFLEGLQQRSISSSR